MLQDEEQRLRQIAEDAQAKKKAIEAIERAKLQTEADAAHKAASRLSLPVSPIMVSDTEDSLSDVVARAAQV